ncbi:MAG: cytochrome c [Arenicellales bacterium]|nr:cytochrome c [Arenicellales bacterium]
MTKASKRWRLPGLTALMTVICLGSIQSSQAAQSGEQVFQSLCTACHTIGKGKLVGPDLAGVTSRREASWLVRQIQEPDSLIAENDPIAMQLLQEANGVPMVRLGLTDAQVSAVVSYLQSIEQQAVVASGLPSQYVPTVIISVVLLIVLTLIGLIVGRKKVEVR